MGTVQAGLVWGKSGWKEATRISPDFTLPLEGTRLGAPLHQDCKEQVGFGQRAQGADLGFGYSWCSAQRGEPGHYKYESQFLTSSHELP